MDFTKEKAHTSVVTDREIREFLSIFPVSFSNIGEEVPFSPMFERLVFYAQSKLSLAFQKVGETGIFESLSRQIAKRLSWLGIRCMILEMRKLKQEGLLKGENSKQEYTYFLERYLKDYNFQNKCYQEYPVMRDLAILKIKKFGEYVEELERHIIEDKASIVSELCRGKEFLKVLDIQMGLSDEHYPGKTVTKVMLDNGYTIYHKPHGLVSTWHYNLVCQWALKQCGLESFEYKILDRHTYGWELEVTYESCKREAEIAEYYRRMGIQLCLAYVFDITDLHFENVIAHKQYPVIIDLEFFKDRRINMTNKPAYLKDLLKDTVLNMGLLPVKDCVNVGGVGMEKEQKAPYKMPTIMQPNTSDMHIAYEYPKINSTKNMPRIDGQRCGYTEYVSDIIIGFEECYRHILRNQEVIKNNIRTEVRHKSRYLLRSTQEYFMYQNSSNFPELLESWESRNSMLCHMQKGLICEEKYREEILKYEIVSVSQLVFPVFYADGNNLLMGDGGKVKDFFKNDGVMQTVNKIDRLCLRDLELQKKIMEATFLSSLKTQYKERKKHWKGEKCLTSHLIADLIIDSMHVCTNEFGWMEIRYNQKKAAYVHPADVYFYSGLSGIAVFMTAIAQCCHNEKYSEHSRRLVDRLFEHTEKLCEGNLNISECRWGMFTGETSVVYTYWLLYRITKQEIFLKAAEKHSDIIRQNLDKIEGSDLLDGKAGVIRILLHLYGETKRIKYLRSAQALAETLIKEGIDMKEGVGWLASGQSIPLAGLAHGNAGISLVLAQLWKYTEDKKYLNILNEAIRYEDSLYSARVENWMDVRERGCGGISGQDTVAWCHGAAGIAIARNNIYKDIGIRVGRVSIHKIINKIMKTTKQDTCLCHGNIGLWEALKYIGNENQISRDCFWYYEGLSVEDRNSVGFMTGLSGIGYSLLRKTHPEIPNIICSL